MERSIKEWIKKKLWKTAFKKFKEVWSASSKPYSFKLRLSSTSFTWAILEYFVPNNVMKAALRRSSNFLSHFKMTLEKEGSN